MAQPYLGEIRIFAGNFAPYGWGLCDGQLLQIDDYDTLFQLIGTTYGGDGLNTYALPDLRGRLPLHYGNGYTLASTLGVESVALTAQQIPAHQHSVSSSSQAGTTNSPAGNVWAAGASPTYAPPGSAVTSLRSGTVQDSGVGLAHENRMPFLGLNFIISLFGIYPSQA